MFASHHRAFGVCAAIAVALVSTTHAQDKMGTKMDSSKMSGKMESKPASKMADPIYACSKCKMYVSPDAAKKMAYKDPMGHKMTRMSKAPAGYKDGSKIAGKMDKMETQDKVSGGTKM